MIFIFTFLVAVLPFTFASPVPARIYARNATTSASSAIAPIEDLLKEASNGASASKLLSDAHSAIKGLFAGGLIKRDTTESTASASELLDSFLDPRASTVSSLLSDVLKRKDDPQSTTALTPASALTSSSTDLSSLLSPVTSTMSSLLGAVLSRSPIKQRTLLDSLGGVSSALGSVNTVTTGLGYDVATVTKGILNGVL